MALNCSGSLMRFVLIVINIVFFLMGIGFMIPGILVQVNADIVTSRVEPVLSKISFGSLNLWSVASSLSIVIIIIGVFIAVIASLGLFGAWCQNRMFLAIYALLVSILFILKLVIVIVFAVFKQKVETEIQTQFKATLVQNYKYDDLTSSQVSSAFNMLFIQGSCCGVNAVESPYENDFTSTPWKTSTVHYDNIPKACCGAPNTPTGYASFSKPSCTQSVTKGEFFSTGCYQYLRNLLVKYSNMFIGVGAGILVLEVLGIIGAIMMFRQLKNGSNFV